MKTLIAFALICAVAIEATTWEAYKDTYNKRYSSAKEDSLRRTIFFKNKRAIKTHNQETGHSFTMGLNHFSDMTPEEIAATAKGFDARMINKTHRATVTHIAAANVELPAEVDWRKHGAVTEVKNQGNCGSCWAFSATGTLEGQHFRKTGKLVSLSEKQLVDCTASFGMAGCNGGIPEVALKYVAQNGGLDTEKSYPYIPHEGACHFHADTVGATDKFVAEVAQSEEALKEAVATVGPISVAIDANHPKFMSYKSGVFDIPDCTGQLDHAVLVVGYGTDKDSGKDYWLVKNSWSTAWGEDGYIKMARNKGDMCSIATLAVYPMV